MSDSRKIFETNLARVRREKALARQDYPDFLDKIIVQELLSRLEMIERKFDQCLILGQAGGRFVKELRRSQKLKSFVASPSFDVGKTDVWESNAVFDSEWLPFRDNSLDCIIAPPGLERVNDLPGVLIQINRALKPDGLLLAAMFGGETLKELRHAWLLADEETSGGASPRVAPFVDVRQSGNLLQRAGFALPVSDMETHIVRYDDASDLMREIKQMGLSNPLAGRRQFFTSNRMIKRVNVHYKQLFSDDDGRVRSTVEINYLTGWCPHESQQQPLKPGTGEKSLVEFFAGEEKQD